jgi:hypothetical protein
MIWFHIRRRSRVQPKIGLGQSLLRIIGLGACLTLAGCGDGQHPQSESDKHLKALSVYYGRFMSVNRGVGPPNEAEFKKFVKSRPAAELEGFGFSADTIDQMFTSPRDQQPYGVAWKIPSGVPKPDGTTVMVIWEQNGVNGKRFVADAVGRIDEIDDATFQQRLVAIPKGK